MTAEYPCRYFALLMFAPVMSSGHAPADCFNGFDNFDSCWEKIEDLCLDEASGRWEECYPDPGGDGDHHHHDAGESQDSATLFPHSHHCYARCRIFYLSAHSSTQVDI